MEAELIIKGACVIATAALAYYAMMTPERNEAQSHRILDRIRDFSRSVNHES